MDINTLRVNLEAKGGMLAHQHKLIANGVIREGQLEAIDSAVVEAARGAYNVMADLAGVTRQINLGTLISSYERRSKKDLVTIGMRVDQAVDRERQRYDKKMVAVPGYMTEFSVDARELAAAENAEARGETISLDTSEAEGSARAIVESVEGVIFNGADVKVSGAELVGVLNHPDGNGASLAAAWTASGADPVQDVIKAIQANRDAGYRGPVAVWYPDAWNYKLIEDYSSTKGDNTVMQRIMAIDQVQSMRATSALTNKVVVCQLTSDVVDNVVGQPMTVYPWEERGGLVLKWASLYVGAVRFKSDIDGNAGFTVLS